MKFNSVEINSENTWQIGTGDGSRMYADVFLKYGVACLGPGKYGKEGSTETSIYYKNNPDVHNWGATLKQVKKDQWIIARKGKQVIVAIGKVIGEYNYSNLFEDVEGWDLQHYISVQWYKPKTQSGTIVFDGKPLGQSTLLGCNNPAVFEEIYKYNFEEVGQKLSLENLNIGIAITIVEIVDALIDNGIRIQDAENISNTIYRIIRLAQWYGNNDSDALESEIISFLIIPLLIALGWSEQKIKMEYANIDIALFKRSFTGDYNTNPEMIIEAKTFGDGLAFTYGQIQKYAEVFPDCKKFLATNGFRYKYYERENDKLIETGYFNLLCLRERNIIFDIPKTSVETILEISNLK